MSLSRHLPVVFPLSIYQCEDREPCLRVGLLLRSDVPLDPRGTSPRVSKGSNRLQHVLGRLRKSEPSLTVGLVPRWVPAHFRGAWKSNMATGRRRLPAKHGHFLTILADLSFARTPLGFAKTSLGIEKSRLRVAKMPLGIRRTVLDKPRTEVGAARTQLGVPKTLLGRTRSQPSELRKPLTIPNTQLGAARARLHSTRAQFIASRVLLILPRTSLIFAQLILINARTQVIMASLKLAVSTNAPGYPTVGMSLRLDANPQPHN
jgi:hypothetical protein